MASRTCCTCPRRRPATGNSLSRVTFALGTQPRPGAGTGAESCRSGGAAAAGGSSPPWESPSGNRRPTCLWLSSCSRRMARVRRSTFRTMQRCRSAMPFSAIPGVGDVRLPTARDYAMVAWLDPEKVAARNLTAGEVVAALRAQNVQVSAGVLNQPPVPTEGAFQLNVETLGRLTDPAQFENVIVKTDAQGRVTRVRDLARVELTAQNFQGSAYLDGIPSQPIPIFSAARLQRPGNGESCHRGNGDGGPQSPPGLSTAYPSTRRNSSPSPRRRSTRPSSKRWPWSCWSSFCFCKVGGRPSFRSWRYRFR